MTNELTLEQAREMADAALIEALQAGLEMSEDGIRRACIAVAVLEERGAALPMLPEVFRYAQSIATGQLSAHAGLILGRFPYAVQAVLKLPRELQDRIADGEKVKIAVMVKGRVQSAEATIFEMSQMQMRLAFEDGRITPWEQQGEYLHKNPQAHAAPKVQVQVRVDRETREIVVNRTHVTVDALIPALAALGFTVKPAYGTKGFTPVKVS